MGNSTRHTGWLWLAGFLFFTGFGNTQAQTPDSAVIRCVSVQHEQILRQRNPNRAAQIETLNRQVEQLRQGGAALRTEVLSNEIYRIPVVFHVIHSTTGGTIGGANNTNIADDQITSQIQVLNEDYRRVAGTNGSNTNPIGADARIEFYLATTDPNGAATTGITRHYYAQKTSFDAYTDDVLLSQIAYWPTDQYLNIWVAPLQNRILGYGQFPAAVDTLKGLDPFANERTDGVIVDYRYVGRQTGAVTSTTYNLGRTLTHEIGHWLGLIHPNGDTKCGDDYVADTPPTEALNNTTQCTQTYSNCNGTRTRDLIEDYMDYSPDRCMNLFTQGQVLRMRTVIGLSPRRQRVVKATGALAATDVLTVTVYPNPAYLETTADVQFKGSQTFTATLFDLTGRPVRTYQYQNTSSTRLTLNVTGLSAGIYVLRVVTGSETQARRIVIR